MYHVPVMLEAAVGALEVKKGGVYLDATLGGGGHSKEIIRRGGIVYGIDRDNDAICECSGVEGLHPIKGIYENAKQLLENEGITELDGALMDLGVSSHQLDDSSRGFSYSHDAPLDMRMSVEQALTAYDVVNDYDARELKRILFEYGEERFAESIVNAIVKQREKQFIRTTGELSKLISDSVPHRKGAHPAKKTFQAIRIEVNGELQGLDKALCDIFSLLTRGGRLAVITFHSLEDRLVKNRFALLATDCICPKNLPICACNHKREATLLKKQKSDEKEIKQNPRCKSATLRVVEKI